MTETNDGTITINAVLDKVEVPSEQPQEVDKTAPTEPPPPPVEVTPPAPPLPAAIEAPSPPAAPEQPPQEATPPSSFAIHISPVLAVATPPADPLVPSVELEKPLPPPFALPEIQQIPAVVQMTEFRFFSTSVLRIDGSEKPIDVGTDVSEMFSLEQLEAFERAGHVEMRSVE